MKRPCRVLSIANTLVYGGDENRLLSFATHVDPSRLDLHVGVLKRSHPELDRRDGTLRPEFEARGIPLVEFGEQRYDRGPKTNMLRRIDRTATSFARAIKKAADFVTANEIDVIDGHVGPSNHVAAAVGLMTGRPAVVTTYHAEFFEPRWLSYPFEQTTLRTASVIVTDSIQRADAIRRFAMGSKRRIDIIANGVSAPAPTRGADDVARELGIPSDASVVIGQIAGLVESKGWMVFLDAAKRVLKSEPDAYFLCVGHERQDRTFRSLMEARLAELGIADRVTIASYGGPIGDVWQLVDIHAHASLFDSLPNAIIEGMSLAKPAVVTDVGDVAKMVDDGNTGIVVPPNDAAAFAAALLRLVREPQSRARLARGAHDRYLERHQPRAMASQLEDLFIELSAS